MGKRAVDTFNEIRQKLNKKVLDFSGIPVKRFFSLDTQTYREGFLDLKTKELLGLVASMVLRCDDCVKYHLGRCFDEKVSDGELDDAFNVALIAGGSIVIPHLRRAVEYWEDLCNYQQDKETETIINSVMDSFINAAEKIKTGKSLKNSEQLDSNNKSSGIIVINNKMENILQILCDDMTKKIERYSTVLFCINTSNEKKFKMIYNKDYDVGENLKSNDTNICIAVMKEKKTICIDKCSTNNPYNQEKTEIKSKIAVPLLKNNKAIGAFIVGSLKVNAFTSTDTESLECLAYILMETIW